LYLSSRLIPTDLSNSVANSLSRTLSSMMPSKGWKLEEPGSTKLSNLGSHRRTLKESNSYRPRETVKLLSFQEGKGGKGN